MHATELCFGDLLRRLRTAAALSQEALAERAGLSRNAISELERGLHQAPRLETVRLLADALALEADDQRALVAAARPAVWPTGSAARAPSRPASLPVPLTRLIGRETEVRTLQDRLRNDTVRWLTLTGPGGVGKTRLAIAVASTMADAFAEGMVFVDLTPLTGPELVAPTIAAALGVREAVGRHLIESLATFLAPQRLLLVLDNCERSLAAASDLAELLGAGPGLTLFATSRAPFRVRGEHEVPVPPLPLPGSDRLWTRQDLVHVPAIALFVERAAATQPDFALTTHNDDAVTGICRRLDGLPLAIELAAAQVNVLPPRALLARLERRLPLLTGGSQDLPGRQRTMRDAIAWSYDLLAPDEQAAFRRLSVFAGGCTWEAIEAVGQGEGGPGVLVGVAALVQHSLLRQIADSEEDPRYLMLETVREYGLEQLSESGESEDIGQRHAEWCVAWLERLQRSGGLSQGRGLAAVETELPNARAALSWYLAQGMSTAAMHLAGLLAVAWLRHGHLREGTEWSEHVLAADQGGPTVARVEALVGLTMLLWQQDRYEQAAQLLHEAEAVAMAVGNDWARAYVRLHQGYHALQRGDLDLAEAHAEEVAATFTDTGDLFHFNGAVWMLARVALVRGDDARAADRHERLLAAARVWGDEVSLSNGLFGLAVLAERRGETWQALVNFAEAAAISRDFGDGWAATHGLEGVAAAVAHSRPDAAVRLFAATDALRRMVGAAPVSPFELDRPRHQRAFEDARQALGVERFAAAWAAGAALSLEAAVAEAEALSGSEAEELAGRTRGDRAAAIG
jgi:predicted ATPase/DNA-binding XRE family transcriptional regulator